MLDGDKLPASFWAKVCPEPNSGCWLWAGAAQGRGYGYYAPAGKPKLAHRVAYEALVAPIPDGLTIDHLCRVRSCVNPGHMEVVSRGENAIRGGGSAVHAAKRRAQTHCKHGHEFTPENTYVWAGNGRRDCRTCNRHAKRYSKGKR